MLAISSSPSGRERIACRKYSGTTSRTLSIRSCEGAWSVLIRSGRAGPGQSSVPSARQSGNSPVKPCSSRTRCLKSRIQVIASGVVTSSPRTITSTSPETPVTSWSSSTDSSAGRSAGTSSRTSETTSVWVPTPQPSTASAAAVASTRPGAAIAIASAERPNEELRARIEPPRRRARAPAVAKEAAAPSSASGAAMVGRRRARDRAGSAEERAARPAVREIASAEMIPITRAKANSRTIGIGESTSERKPTVVASAAVAITGPPRTAAITAAAAGRWPASAASRKRAWSWIA